MQCFRRCLLFFAGLFVIVLFISMAFLYFAASWLYIPNAPKKSDVIFILGGMPTRAVYAADLYLEGYSKNVVISKPILPEGVRQAEDMGVQITHMEDVYYNILIKKGVPEDAISVMTEPVISTAEEAVWLKQLFAGQAKRILIVTSPYHVKRSEMIFKDLLPEHEIIVVATTYENYPEKWWTSQDLARNVLLEFAKILFYQFGGRYETGHIQDDAIR